MFRKKDSVFRPQDRGCFERRILRPLRPALPFIRRPGYNTRLMIRMILFDIDGTLIESDGSGAAAFERVFRSLFKIHGAAAKLDFRGNTDRGILRGFFERHDLEPSEENFERFCSAYVHWLEQLLVERGGRTLPGIRRLLRELAELRRPLLSGLLTGNIRLGAEIKLRRFGIWDSFTTGAFGCEHHERNQLAAIARDRGSRILDADLAGEQILVIGDTPRDVECAKSIGARSVAVATGAYRRDQLEAHQPDFIFDDLSRVSLAELCG